MNEILRYVLIGFGVFLFGVLFFTIWVKIQRVRFQYRRKFTVLEVRVSKENETGPIVAEQIFATLHGLRSKFGLLQRLRGFVPEHISFEIASVRRVIKFHVAFPEQLRNLVEGQIYAQYPDVEIEDVTDYASNMNAAKSAVAVDLRLMAPDVFPIKRYSQFEDRLTRVAVDPLSGITSSLLKFYDPDDQAWIQIVVRPLNDKWRNVFTKCVKILNKGVFGNIGRLVAWYANAFTTRKLWPKFVFFPLYFLFWFQGLLAQAGIDKDLLKAGGHSSGTGNVDESTSSQHDRETVIGAAMDKVLKLLYEVNIRIVYVPKHKNNEAAKVKIQEIVGAFKQFSFPHLNGFAPSDYYFGGNAVNKYRKRIINDAFVLNNEELATIYHLPNISVKTPTIYWVASKKLEPPVDLPDEDSVVAGGDKITVLGKTNFRGKQQVFGIKPVDRRRHTYVIGKTGMGKSTLLENMIFSDVHSGKGVGVIDPHGDLADAVLNFIPPHRTNDVVLIDPADREYAVAFNMLEDVDPALKSIVCSGLVGIFKKIYANSWGPRLEHILRNTILTLLEYPGTSMLGITRILQDDDFRRRVVRKIEDPVVKTFWLGEFEKMQERMRVEAISPILNKVGQFLSSQTIRNIVGQVKSSVDLRFAMDKGKIVIINLSKGKIGEDNSSLLGAMFITKFQLDAMSRANIPQNQRKDFYLYVDEFQNFATESFATILSEARKYCLNLTMANQYIAQMPDEVRDAVFGNVGSILAFQVGFDDADYLSQQFGEQVLPSDLVSLSKYSAYMKLLVDGMPTKTFSMVTLPPPEIDFELANPENVRKVSRERYANKISVIQDKIKRWSAPVKKDEDDGEERVNEKRSDSKKDNAKKDKGGVKSGMDRTFKKQK